jgi:hypothetical protein
MPESLTKLIADLQHVVQQISDANGKEESQPSEGEISTHEPDTASTLNSNTDEENLGEVNDLLIKDHGRMGGLVIGVDLDKNSPVTVERIEVIPEPDKSVRVMVRAKKEQHR